LAARSLRDKVARCASATAEQICVGSTLLPPRLIERDYFIRVLSAQEDHPDHGAPIPLMVAPFIWPGTSGRRCAATISYGPPVTVLKRLGKLRLFVMAITAHRRCSPRLTLGNTRFLPSPCQEATMSFNYLTNSTGFTRIAAYVGQLVDSAVDARIETISQNFRPDPATRCLNRPCELSELMSRTIAP
jgi:hypothetical protein